MLNKSEKEEPGSGSGNSGGGGPIAEPGITLVRMTAEFIEAMIERQGGAGHEFDGVRLWDGWTEESSPWLRVRLTELGAMPELVTWLLYAIVRRADRQMVGHVGFHSAPGPPYLHDIAHDGIEIGYSVFAPFKGRGYATAAASELIGWARREHEVREFVASISHDNAASIRVAEKLGFKFLREFDPTDPDREDVYLLHVSDLARDEADA
ncbi:MAG: GNAT family N-acetyltransferase [Chloroflexi bacterium]|nr:GNAT family N-acetyltransferase [Chloroflexota bacterium]